MKGIWLERVNGTTPTNFVTKKETISGPFFFALFFWFGSATAKVEDDTGTRAVTGVVSCLFPCVRVCVSGFGAGELGRAGFTLIFRRTGSIKSLN